MLVEIDGIRLHYHVSGQGYPVILLHGWGGSIQSFAPVHAHLEKDFTVYSLDMPGFGDSPEPPVIWGTKEYAELVEKFLHQLNIEKPIIMGHSFGGRLTIRLAAKQIAKKIILVDSAGIPPKRGMGYYFRVYRFKCLKGILSIPGLHLIKPKVLDWYRNKYGSSDYKETSGVMRGSFIQVVNEDLRPLLSEIKVPSLLVWGDNDTATPLSDGQLMEEKIPDSGLVVLKGTGHFSYLEKLGEFLLVIDSFLQKEREAR